MPQKYSGNPCTRVFADFPTLIGKNLFKADQTSFINSTNTGFTGFFQPRYLNRTFGFQDPLTCSNIDTNPKSVCSLQNTGAETFESSIWEYSL